jgi:hypothetical protein
MTVDNENGINNEATRNSENGSKLAFYVWAGGLVFAVGFTFLIWAVGPMLDPVLSTLLPDQGADWYFWKLPVREFMTMLIVWSFYLANQF